MKTIIKKLEKQLNEISSSISRNHRSIMMAAKYEDFDKIRHLNKCINTDEENFKLIQKAIQQLEQVHILDDAN